MSRRRAAFATHSAPPAWRCTSGLLLRGGASWPIWHAVLHPPQVLPPCGLRGLPSACPQPLRALPAGAPELCARPPVHLPTARVRYTVRRCSPAPTPARTTPIARLTDLVVALIVRAASRQPARQPCRRLPARLLACPPAAARDGRTLCVSSGHPNGGGAALFGRRPSCPGVPVSRGREWPHTGCAPRHRWPWVAVGGRGRPTRPSAHCPPPAASATLGRPYPRARAVSIALRLRHHLAVARVRRYAGAVVDSLSFFWAGQSGAKNNVSQWPL